MDAARMDCPVCPARDLDPELAACPSCGTDLGPLRRVRELAARAAEARAIPLPPPPGPEASARPTPWSRLPADAKLALGVLALWVPISLALLLGTRRPRPAAAGEHPPAMSDSGTIGEAAGGGVFDSTASGPASLLAGLEGLQGATAAVEGAGVRIVFGDGIFASGSERATESGLASLRAAGRALAAAAAGGGADRALVVEVVGACDDRPTRPGGRWQDNWSLALGRAGAAAAVLRAEAASAPVRWRVSSAGEAEAPWSNDTEAGRARNRTVVLYVTWAGAREDQP